MIRRLRLHVAKLRLALVDAQVAHWYVHDGQLSEHPLRGRLRGGAIDLRERRLEAVRRLESLGGRDPWPTVMREPTEAQRAALGNVAREIAEHRRTNLDEARALLYPGPPPADHIGDRVRPW